MRAAALLATVLLAGASAASAQPAAPAAQGELVARAHEAIQVVRRNDAPIRELAGMGAVDQLVRHRFLPFRADADKAGRAALDAFWDREIEPIDKAHVARLKVLLRGRDWFKVSEVGEDAARSAFHVVQHSGDLEFMKMVLAKTEPLVASDEFSGTSYALLYDRVARMEKRLQRYGTQTTACDGERFAPPGDVEDPARLDERRRSVGMPPMAEHIRRINEAQLVCQLPG